MCSKGYSIPMRHNSELCSMTDIFWISTYIGCNLLVYIPDHLLLCVLISNPIVVIKRLWSRPIPTYTDSLGSLLICSLPPEISVVVVINRLRPRTIPTVTYWFYLYPKNVWHSCFRSSTITIQIEYNFSGLYLKSITTNIGRNRKYFGRWTTHRILYNSRRDLSVTMWIPQASGDPERVSSGNGKIWFYRTLRL